MKNNTIHEHVAISLTLIALAALACNVGWRPVDQFSAPRPGDLDEMRRQAIEDEMEREQRERELRGLPSEGDFVSPVAPQAQPVASLVAPQSGAPIITSIDFPSTIPADGVTYFGWVAFTDTGGDVSRLRLHVVHSTTPMSDWEGKPGTLAGTASAGKYRIAFYCTIPSLHTMQVMLIDAAGNPSNPMDFSWECK